MVLTKRNTSLRHLLILTVMTSLQAEGFSISIKPFAAITLNKKSTQAIVNVEKNLSKTDFKWRVNKATSADNPNDESRFFVNGIDPYQGEWIWSFEDFVRRYTAEDAEPYLNNGALQKPKDYGPFGPNVWVNSEFFKNGLQGHGNIYVDKNWRKKQVGNNNPSSSSNLIDGSQIKYLPARSEKFFSIYRPDLIVPHNDKDLEDFDQGGSLFLPVTDVTDKSMKIFVIFDDSLTDDKSKFKGGPSQSIELTEVPIEDHSYSHEYSTYTRVALASSRVLRDRSDDTKGNKVCFDRTIKSAGEYCDTDDDTEEHKFLHLFFSSDINFSEDGDLSKTLTPVSLYQPGPAATGTLTQASTVNNSNGYITEAPADKMNVPLHMTNYSAIKPIPLATNIMCVPAEDVYLSNSQRTIEYHENFEMGYANDLDIFNNHALKNGVNLADAYGAASFDQRYSPNVVFAKGAGTATTMDLEIHPVPFMSNEQMYSSHLAFFSLPSSDSGFRTLYNRGIYDEARFATRFGNPLAPDDTDKLIQLSVMIPPRLNPELNVTDSSFISAAAKTYTDRFNDDFRRLRPASVKHPTSTRTPFDNSKLSTQRYITPSAGKYYVVIPHMHDTFNKDMYRMGSQHSLENCQDMVWGCANSNYLEDLFVIKPVNPTSINYANKTDLNQAGRGEGYSCKAPNSLRNLSYTSRNIDEAIDIDEISGEIVSAHVGENNKDYTYVRQKQFVSIYNEADKEEATYWGGVCHPLVVEQKKGITDQVYQQKDYDQLEYYDTTIGLEASINITNNIDGVIRTSLSAPIEYVEHTSKFIKIRPYTNIGLHAGMAFGSENGKLSVTYGMNSERVTAELVKIGLSERTGARSPSDLIKGRTSSISQAPVPRFLDLINSKEELTTFYSSFSINASIQLTPSLAFYINSDISNNEYDIEILNTIDKSKVLNQRLSVGAILDYQE